MRAAKWLPWILGIPVPVAFLAVTALRTENPGSPAPAPQASVPAPPAEEAVPNPRPKSRRSYERTYGSGNDQRKVVHRLSEKGSPLTCDVFDAKGTRLLNYRFGYSANPGPLQGKVVEVQVFGGQRIPVPQSGKDTPLERLIYTYDDAGAPRPPITTNLEPTGIATKLRGPALVSFNPVKDAR
jgi:hypothetical protein